MLYCANFYGRCFIRVYEDKMPVIKVCTVQHYYIIRLRYTVVTLIFTILMHSYSVAFCPVFVLWHFVLWHFVRDST